MRFCDTSIFFSFGHPPLTSASASARAPSLPMWFPDKSRTSSAHPSFVLPMFNIPTPNGPFSVSLETENSACASARDAVAPRSFLETSSDRNIGTAPRMPRARETAPASPIPRPPVFRHNDVRLHNALSRFSTTPEGLPKPGCDTKQLVPSLPFPKWKSRIAFGSDADVFAPDKTRSVCLFFCVISSDHGDDAQSARGKRVSETGCSERCEKLSRSKRTCVEDAFFTLNSFVLLSFPRRRRCA
mmetsp:Transcript_11905/g.39563  ORF Transcript_11905/g.39563 Transcript_11905/m.39563 type:complete len:243 (-) Transcript_11905:332-1060(-)